MSMYKLNEYSGNYPKTSGRLWQCHRHKPALNKVVIFFIFMMLIIVLHLNLTKK